MAYIRPQGNQPLILYAQDHDGSWVQASKITTTKTQSFDEGIGTKGSSQVIGGMTHFCYAFLSLEKLIKEFETWMSSSALFYCNSKCFQTEFTISKYNKFPVDTIFGLTVLITTCANWYTCQSS